MTENQFKQDAKSIVDLAFDTKIFKEDVTRDEMTAFEGLISFILQSKFESYNKAKDLLDRLNKKTK